MQTESISSNITLTTSVVSQNPFLVPTGIIVFACQNQTIGVSSLSNGVATLTFAATVLGVGTFDITAYYQGDSNFSAGTSSLLVEVITE